MAAYEGKTGWNVVYRMNKHEDAINSKNLNNGMGKHLAIYRWDCTVGLHSEIAQWHYT